MKERDPKKIREFLGNEICEVLPKSFPALYERVAYIILKFLQSEDKVLFLQFPIEDLSNKENKKQQYWDEICDVIAYAIRLSMKSGELKPAELSYPGDWYKKDDNFILVCSEDSKYPYFFLKSKKDNRNAGKIILDFEYPGFKPSRTSDKREYLQKAKAIFKLTAVPAQIRNGYKKCCEEIELLKCRRFENDYLLSAVAICPAYSHPLTFAGSYIQPIVKIERNNRNYPDSDIIAIVGDKAFDLAQGAINSLDGLTKKVLTFGTQPTTPLTESKPTTITLTFPEMHTYCAPKKVKYFEPEFIEIEFPWLNNTLNALEAILNKVKINESDKTHIYNFSKFWMSQINFSDQMLERFKICFEEFIEEKMEDNEITEISEELIDWSNSLSYDSESNPKADFVKRKKADVIFPNKSVRLQLRNREKFGSRLVLNAPHHNFTKDECPISTVMRYHLFPKLYCLYYKGIETEWMTKAKQSLYKDPFFVSSDIKREDSDMSENVNLDEYQDYKEFLINYNRQFYSPDIFKFDDDTKLALSGDVLLHIENKLKAINVSDIEDGQTITFYSQNVGKRDIFKHLFNAYHNFPEGKDVDYYVNLWQKALKTFSAQTPKESLEALCKDLKITKAVLSNHIEGRSKFMTRSKFTRVLDVLVDKGLIKEEELGFIKAAQNFYNKESISFGSKLKDALYRFRIDENDKSDFLIKLEKKTGYSAAELMGEFLYTKTIKE